MRLNYNAKAKNGPGQSPGTRDISKKGSRTLTSLALTKGKGHPATDRGGKRGSG